MPSEPRNVTRECCGPHWGLFVDGRCSGCGRLESALASAAEPPTVEELGDDLVAIIAYLLRAIEEIRQVAADDSVDPFEDWEAREWIVKRIAAINPPPKPFA